MNTHVILRAGLFFAIIIGSSAVGGYAQTRLDGQWSGWGDVTLRSTSLGYSGTYADTYGTGRGVFSFYRVTDREYAGTWSESSKRHGTFVLRPSADGKTIDVTWKASNNSEIHPGNGGVSLWTRTSPVYTDAVIPIPAPTPAPTPKPEPVKDMRNCDSIADRMSVIDAELRSLEKKAGPVRLELAQAQKLNEEWNKDLAAYKRGLSQRIDLFRKDVTRAKQALRLAKERVTNLEINPDAPNKALWNANMKAALGRVEQAQKKLDTAAANLTDAQARLRNVDKITADKQKLVDHWQEKLNDLSARADKLTGEARFLRSLYDACR